MAMNLDTAIKFTAKLEGTGLDQLKRGLQGLAQQGNVSKRTLDQLYNNVKCPCLRGRVGSPFGS